MNLDKTHVVVSHEMIDDRSSIEIKFVPNERILSVRETAHILVGAISLLIRSCTKEGSTISETKLMAEVIEHLNQEFISIDSFEDLKIDRKSLK